MNSRKEKLLQEINQLDNRMQERKVEYKEKVETSKADESKVTTFRAAYEEIKNALREAETAYSQERLYINELSHMNKLDGSELDSKRRELSRILSEESLVQAYRDEYDAFAERCLLAPWRAENRSDGLGALHHQVDGAIHLALAKQALLGDKRGLGKTLSSFIYLDFIEAKKVIAVVPADTVKNFIREMRMWVPHRTPLKMSGVSRGMREVYLETAEMLDEFVLIVNYEAWSHDKDLVKEIVALEADTLIIDEAHRLKSITAKQSQGVRDIRFGMNQCSCSMPDVHRVGLSFGTAECRTCDTQASVLEFCSIKNVLALTGTPILNYPPELFAIMNLIDPENFKTIKNFQRDFCQRSTGGRWVWQYGGEQRIAKIMGSRYLARDRHSVGVVIPPVTPVDHVIPIETLKEDYPKQYAAYMQAKEYAQIILDPDNEIVMSLPIVLVILMRLRQVLAWPASIKLEVKDPKTDEFLFTKQLEVFESVKIDRAQELIQDIVKEGERIVLFSQFADPLAELNKRLQGNGIKSVVYDGSTSKNLRNEIQLDFDVKTAPVDPRFDVVLCNYKAAGEGLNLNAASQMILLDRAWNPGREEQAIGRIDRMGQKRETTVHYIRVEPSVDIWMDNLIKMKAELQEGFTEAVDLANKLRDAINDGEI